MNAYDIKTDIFSWYPHCPTGYTPTEPEKGIVLGIMTNALRMNDGVAKATGRRHQVLAWIFREELGKPMASAISSKELTPEMWWCLFRFIDPHKDLETGVWVGIESLEEMMIKCWQTMEEWEKEMSQQLGFLDEADLPK